MFISVTDLGGQRRRLQSTDIVGVRAIPETMLMFLDGSTVLVREPVEDIVDMVRVGRVSSRINQKRVSP